MGVAAIVIHGAGINPDGTLQPHTKARADKALDLFTKLKVSDLYNKLYEEIKIIACGKNEAPYIAKYLEEKGIHPSDIIIENASYSTLSNLYYTKMTLHLLSSIYGQIHYISIVSNEWHMERIYEGCQKILKEYKDKIVYTFAKDPREKELIEGDRRLEKYKMWVEKILLSLGYGKWINKEHLNSASPFILEDSKSLENLIKKATPYSQKILMSFEKTLYGFLKLGFSSAKFVKNLKL
ncbi:MAG: YdcF family protein [Candidatus Aenigmatarchaeota archaeon]